MTTRHLVSIIIIIIRRMHPFFQVWRQEFVVELPAPPTTSACGANEVKDGEGKAVVPQFVLRIKLYNKKWWWGKEVCGCVDAPLPQRAWAGEEPPRMGCAYNAWLPLRAEGKHAGELVSLAARAGRQEGDFGEVTSYPY